MGVDEFLGVREKEVFVEPSLELSGGGVEGSGSPGAVDQSPAAGQIHRVPRMVRIRAHQFCFRHFAVPPWNTKMTELKKEWQFHVGH